LEDTERLLLQLRHPSAHMRESAALELVLVADQQALSPLIEALADRDNDVRRTVIQALAGLNLNEALPHFLPLLQDPEPSVAQAACDALIKFGEPGAQILLKELELPDWMSRKAALEVLQSLRNYCPLDIILQQLNAPEWEVRETAARFLVGMQDQRVTIALLNVLRIDPDREVKMAACKALGATADQRVIEPLLLVLRQTEDESLRMAAAEGLARMGALIAEPLVRQVLQDHRSEVRSLGAQILGHVRASSAIPTLMELLRDESRDVRMAAALALSQIENEEALWVLLYHVFLQEPEMSPEAILELAQREDRRAIPYLLDELGRLKEGCWQDVLLTALGDLGESETILPLSVYLKSPLPQVRIAAAQALGRIGHSLALDYLSAALADSDTQVIYQVIESLQRIEPSSEVWKTLLNLLSPDIEERLGALEYFSEQVDERLQPFFLNLLVQEKDISVREELYRLMRKHPEWLSLSEWLKLLQNETNNTVRIEILATLSALPTLDPKLAQPVLLALLEDRDEGIRKATAVVLPHLGTSLVPALYERLRHEIWFVRVAAIQALARMDDEASLRTLLDALKDKDRDVRCEAVLALGQMGNLQAVNPLIETLENGYRDVRAAAASALGELGDTKAVDALQTALIEDENAEVRTASAQALARLGDLGSVSVLLDCLVEDDDEWVREACAQALGFLKEPAALDGLFKALEDESLKVGMAAIEALGLIADPRALAALLETLEFGTRDLRAITAKALGSLGDTGAIPALEEALNDEALLVRTSAAQALGKLQAQESAPALAELLEQSDLILAQAAALALVQLGVAAQALLFEKLPELSAEIFPAILAALAEQSEIVELTGLLKKIQTLPDDSKLKAIPYLISWPAQSADFLIDLLRNTDNHDLRLMSFDLLVKAEAVDKVKDLLQEWDQDIKGMAVKALGKMSSAGLSVLIEAFDTPDEALRLSILQVLSEVHDIAALTLLHKALSLPHLGLSQAAVQALYALGEPALPVLKEALDHPERSIRQMSARALMHLQPQESLWSSLVEMNSQSPEQRERSAESLRKYAQSESISALLRALDDESNRVRSRAVGSLGQLKATQARGLLLESLKDWHRDVREAAVEALGLFGYAEDEWVLLEMLGDPDIHVRNRALTALARMGNLTPLKAALTDVFPEVRSKAVHTLGLVGAQDAIPELLELLRTDPEHQVRAEAAWSLGEIASTERIEPLIQALEDPAIEVRWAAAQALGKCRATLALEPLCQILQSSGEGYLVDIRLQQMAVSALGKIGDLRAIPILVEMVYQPCWGDDELRKQAMRSLAELAAPTGIATLKEMLEFQEPQIAELARQLLEQVAV
jgi:HEAT repeat protein